MVFFRSCRNILVLGQGGGVAEWLRHRTQDGCRFEPGSGSNLHNGRGGDVLQWLERRNCKKKKTLTDLRVEGIVFGTFV